jgi:hypothetical protein
MCHNDNIRVINSINNIFIILNHCSIDIRFETSCNISRTFLTNRDRSVRTRPDRSDFILETGPNRNYYSLNQDGTKIIQKNIDSDRTDPSPIFIR